MKILRLLFFPIILFTLGSCQNDNDTILVEGNIALPDPTIERVLAEGYQVIHPLQMVVINKHLVIK